MTTKIFTVFVFAGAFWSTIVSVEQHQVKANHVYDTFSYRETDWDNHVYGPYHWNFVACHDVESCPGWPTNWEEYNDFIPYDGTLNQCHDCSESNTGACKQHQQSPVQLHRNVTANKECRDRHKMSYEPGNCRWDEMDFQILPHVLRAYQPDNCQVTPWIDYSMGFPDPFDLKFTDFIMPSQHTQDGVQYAAEVVMSGVYSKNKDNKLIGNVAVFLEEGTDDDHYPFLELYERRFANAAQKVEDSCAARRLLKRARDPDVEDMAESYAKEENKPSFERPHLRRLEDATRLPIDYISKSWYTGEFDPFKWYIDTKTEYYFRYNGSMIEPPCFEGVHWRVLKDPIRVSPKQINKLAKLFTRRLNPETCKEDTAGKPRQGSLWMDFNRPHQTVSNRHGLVFCECADWRSRLRTDREWCKLPMEERGVANVKRPAPDLTPSPSVDTSAPSDLPVTPVPSSSPTKAVSGSPTVPVSVSPSALSVVTSALSSSPAEGVSGSTTELVSVLPYASAKYCPTDCVCKPNI